MNDRRPVGATLTGSGPDQIAEAPGELRPAERAVYDRIKEAGGYASPAKIRRTFKRLGIDRDRLDIHDLARIISYADPTGERAVCRVLAGGCNV